MKKSTERYFRTVYISAVTSFCVIIGFLGINKAYESMTLIGSGTKQSIIEITEDSIKIFEYIIYY